MIIEKVLIDQIKPYDKNPRKNDSAVKEVVKSIESVGYRTPIIVDENMVILAGHTRYKALKQMGWAEIPFIVKYDDLTPEKKDEYRIRDNKTGELAEWDFDILLEDFDKETLCDFGFDKDLLSFGVNRDDNKGILSKKYIVPHLVYYWLIQENGKKEKMFGKVLDL